MDNVNRYVQDDGGQWWFLLKGGRRTRAQLWTCAQCGQEFPAYLKRITCSRRCAGLKKRSPDKPLVPCEWCGELFRPKGGGQKRCSHACAAEAMHARRAPTTTLADVGLVNETNPKFSQDGTGQWWYEQKKGYRTRAHIQACKRCGRKALRSVFHRTVYCSRRCAVLTAAAEGRKTRSGEGSHRWKGGRVDQNGYVLVYQPDHHTGRKYVLEHRLVMEQKLGRPLLASEHVHHLNAIKNDNRPENLELWVGTHPTGQRAKTVKHCPTCTCGSH